MMKLSLMGRVLSTLGEDRAWPLAETILHQSWPHDPDTVRFVRASANFIAAFRAGGKRCFLRFNEASERSRETIEAEVKLVAWLAAQGLNVAAPVASNHDRLVETVETELGVFHAVVFTGLEGPHIEFEEMSLDHLRAWGEALGKLHALLKRYHDPSSSARQSWRDHLDLAKHHIAGDDELLLPEWQQVTAWAATLPTSPDDFGLIHFDFESDNLCWTEDGIGSLDFDDCAHYWYAADIAYALRDLFKSGPGFSVYGPIDYADPRLQSFLAGYRGQAELNEQLLAQLPNFLRLHQLYFYGRISRALDLPRDNHVPQWLERLSAKLASGLDAYKDALRASRQ